MTHAVVTAPPQRETRSACPCSVPHRCSPILIMEHTRLTLSAHTVSDFKRSKLAESARAGRKSGLVSNRTGRGGGIQPQLLRSETSTKRNEVTLNGDDAEAMDKSAKRSPSFQNAPGVTSKSYTRARSRLSRTGKDRRSLTGLLRITFVRKSL